MNISSLDPKLTHSLHSHVNFFDKQRKRKTLYEFIQPILTYSFQVKYHNRAGTSVLFLQLQVIFHQQK